MCSPPAPTDGGCPPVRLRHPGAGQPPPDTRARAAAPLAPAPRFRSDPSPDLRNPPALSLVRPWVPAARSQARVGSPAGPRSPSGRAGGAPRGRRAPSGQVARPLRPHGRPRKGEPGCRPGRGGGRRGRGGGERDRQPPPPFPAASPQKMQVSGRLRGRPAPLKSFGGGAGPGGEGGGPAAGGGGRRPGRGGAVSPPSGAGPAGRRRAAPGAAA